MADDEIIPEATRVLLAEMEQRQRQSEAKIAELTASAKASADRADLAQAGSIVARAMQGQAFVSVKAEGHFLRDLVALHGGRASEITQESVKEQLAGDYATFVKGGPRASAGRQSGQRIPSLDDFRPDMTKAEMKVITDHMLTLLPKRRG